MQFFRLCHLLFPFLSRMPDTTVSRSAPIGLSRASENARYPESRGNTHTVQLMNICDPLIHCLGIHPSRERVAEAPSEKSPRELGKKANSNLTNEKVFKEDRYSSKLISTPDGTRQKASKAARGESLRYVKKKKKEKTNIRRSSQTNDETPDVAAKRRSKKSKKQGEPYIHVLQVTTFFRERQEDFLGDLIVARSLNASYRLRTLMFFKKYKK